MGIIGKIGREVVKKLDYQAETGLIFTINDTSIGDLPLIMTISDTSKNQTKRFDSDNPINLSRLIVNLEAHRWSHSIHHLYNIPLRKRPEGKGSKGRGKCQEGERRGVADKEEGREKWYEVPSGQVKFLLVCVYL